ncbi:MAG: peptide ABC transporter substrate-binding protein [Proteobacteria bacterium]|nr:peptide ABC transporter substrate-binding protein [Pseudomonadota bacterium]MDA1286873.1 peptide ABC transporter substrate-binding protein [Pseudomonadota bacterium]
MKIKTILMGAAAAVALAPAAFAGRGDSGHVNIIFWQAASILNPYLSGGTKDVMSSSMIIEPLARYDENGNMVPWLVDTIPTVANGGVSEDLTSITWKLKSGVIWSDGSALTSADVVFTVNYCMDPAGGCQQLAKFADIASVEALDDMTVKITFNKAKPFPYGPMVGSQTPVIQQAQFKDCVGIKAPECTAQNFGPIGTGPFVVTDFKANDVIALVANPNYRDAAKPAFASVTLKGGGDAAAAARSVLETGEFDYGWNLQVDPAIMKQMASAGKGQVVSAFGTSVERLMINATNPDPALGDKRGTVEGGPHPYLYDPAVRKALSMAIDRQVISDVGYGPTGKPTCNVLPAPAIYASTANDSCLVQDIAGANKMLDDAGWARGSDGIRAKNGVRISILYQTSTNAVRQDTQALVKQWWNEIGVEVELKNISASVFFGGDQSSPDTFQKFFSDVEMYTNNFDGTDPEAYMGGWVCSEAPTPANNWLGANMPRYCNPAYDALSAEMSGTGDLNERARLAKSMNDMLIQDGAIIALVHRGNVSAHANSLAGVKLNPWDSEMWNIADWSRN